MRKDGFFLRHADSGIADKDNLNEHLDALYQLARS